jgi:sigma-B regulation protein RsbU (phosphoserine phosphatase)
MIFLLADVAGKGIAAAMQSANLRAVFRALVPMGLGMEQMMAQASRLFCESTPAAQYATVVAGRVSGGGELEVVNAGHLPVLLARGAGCKAFDSTDLPLGMFCDQHFTVAKSRLLPGDMLVLYTDGISEAQNHRGEEYGVQSLQSLIDGPENPCPELLVRACREHVDAFRAGRERADDETLLVIQYQPDGKLASYPAAMITGQGAA